VEGQFGRSSAMELCFSRFPPRSPDSTGMGGDIAVGRNSTPQQCQKTISPPNSSISFLSSPNQSAIFLSARFELRDIIVQHVGHCRSLTLARPGSKRAYVASTPNAFRSSQLYNAGLISLSFGCAVCLVIQMSVSLASIEILWYFARCSARSYTVLFVLVRSSPMHSSTQ
jgi:hypothetical protein